MESRRAPAAAWVFGAFKSKTYPSEGVVARHESLIRRPALNAQSSNKDTPSLVRSIYEISPLIGGGVLGGMVAELVTEVQVWEDAVGEGGGRSMTSRSSEGKLSLFMISALCASYGCTAKSQVR
jgi:hypothetical protein